MNAPIRFSSDGEQCASCGVTLAADQRYCLSCGQRRGSARLPFLEILRDEPVSQLIPLGRPLGAAGIPAGPQETGLAAQARANAGLIASVGVLLLAMLIGVLVGSGIAGDGSSTAAANQKPIVVSVGGGVAAPEAAAAAPAAADTPTDTGAATTTKPKSDDKTAGDAASKSDATSKAAEAAVKPKAAGAAKLKSLDKLSGKEYQKQVDKLGKNIAVGGKAPPKDNKPAAGGGDFEDIG